MTLMARGMAWLADKTAVAAGVTVTYTRGPRTVALTAAVGDQQQQANLRLQTQAAAVAWSQRDYLIDAAEFEAAALPGDARPLAGDRVTETVGGVVTVFELMKGPNGEPCWRWGEPERLTYRVHTKRVSG